MCQVNGRWSFSATWGSETPEPIHVKSGTFDYIHSPTPHAKYGGHQNGGGVGIWVKLYPRMLYFVFSMVPSMHPQLTTRSVDFCSGHTKMCFGGGCVPLGSICPGGQIFPFCPKNHFSIGRIKLSFCMGVNRKNPLRLMIAP